MQFQHGNLIIVFVMASLGATIGCAKILEDQGELERVDATVFYDSTSSSIPSAYAVELPEQRTIRRIIVHSVDRIRNTDIYVRSGKTGGFMPSKSRAGLKGLPTLIFELEEMPFE